MKPEASTPSEFVGFVRDIGVRSFDYFASRVTDDRSPFHKLAAYWSELAEEQKSRFFDQLIMGAQVVAASAMVGRLARRQMKAVPTDARAASEPAETKDKKKKKSAGGESALIKEKKKNKKKADGKKAKNKDKKGKKKKTKKGVGVDADSIPSVS